MNILITGIHGFVGTNLIKAFGKNHNIYGLYIVTPKKDEVIKTYTWNELNIDTLKDIDVIIHLAGKAHDTKKQTNAHLPLNSERLTKLTENYVASNSKIKNTIGITNMPIKATDGLKITIKSFKK